MDTIWGVQLSIHHTGPIRLLPEWSMLRSARFLEGLSQQELADDVHTTRRTISALERGLSVPSLGLALALARRFDVAVDELFDA